MFKKKITESLSTMQLGIVSFNTAAANQLFRFIEIPGNENCKSLNVQSNLLQSDEEDDLIVSFICNTQLFIVDTSFRPSYSVDLSEFTNSTLERTK